MEGEGSSSNETYKECLRNHAASLGSYATDGCGEFTLDDNAAGELKCAACGCHRNFHRKISIVSVANARRGGEVVEIIEYGEGHHNSVDSHEIERSGKKRVRTKFTVEQKEKMLGFAEKLEWKLRRKDQEDDNDEIERFCRNVGVSRQVFKVWMHNHKNISSSSPSMTGNASSLTQ